MIAKLAIGLLALTAPSFTGCGDRGWQGDADADLRERAAAIHRESIVIDGHKNMGG